MRIKYTKELLEPLVKQSTSLYGVVRLLGKQTTGGAASHVSKVIKKFNIDTSHWTGSGWSKGMTFKKVPIEEYLSNKRFIKSNDLKKRLIKEGFFAPNCCHCLHFVWMGKPILLELHHLDCNHNNNTLENLTILCPTCHALAHRELVQKKNTKPQKQKKLKSIGNGQQFARPEQRTIDRPPLDVLLSEIQEHGYSATGRKYGVSDNAIRKWIKCYQKYGK